MTDLLLSEAWDLTDDGSGNLAVTPSEAYAIAQTVANEIKLFATEGWYDESQGTPHFGAILGVDPNYAFIKQTLMACASNVYGVRSCDMDLYIDDQRQLHGNLFLYTNDGTTMNVQF
ncbi:hypothetical protein COMNV_00869 [Commensalibacter sp. Nvir]|uniref:hypothetical protein n=1 Tax=Commensalibacter sp. Nvir TaxID=3069817 RepID=UPI002D67BAE0|nr:hypothetical protein COMNV_00869 [Commensalibacter sp. Nvir]